MEKLREFLSVIDERPWFKMLCCIVVVGIVTHSCKAQAYDKSVCGMGADEFRKMWHDEAGEVPFFAYKDKLGTTAESELEVTKTIMLNPDTGTWTLVFSRDQTVCTMRNGKGIHFYAPPAPESEA